MNSIVRYQEIQPTGPDITEPALIIPKGFNKKESHKRKKSALITTRQHPQKQSINTSKHNPTRCYRAVFHSALRCPHLCPIHVFLQDTTARFNFAAPFLQTMFTMNLFTLQFHLTGHSFFTIRHERFNFYQHIRPLADTNHSVTLSLRRTHC